MTLADTAQSAPMQIFGMGLGVVAGWALTTLSWAQAAAPAAKPGAAASQAPAATVSSAVASLALKPCHLRGVSNTSMCGTLARPLDPAEPAGKTIDIHVAVLPAVARHKKPDPIFFFAGGPGQSAIDLAGAVASMLTRFGNRRDIVLIDQRGTGRSAKLVCNQESPWRPLAEMADPEVAMKRLAQCPTQLASLPHGDTRFYTTSIAMQDADAVRQALGYARVNLMGGSYGTRAALEYMRQFPGAVRSAVIDGVAPPDMVLPQAVGPDAQSALDQALAHCQQDAVCRARYPDLRGQLDRLLASLPRTATVRHPATAIPESLTITRDMVIGSLRWPLYSPAMTAMLPLAISEASTHGRFDVLMALSMALTSARGDGMADGMHFAVICAEDVPRLQATQPGKAVDFGASFGELYRQVCQSWPRAQVPAAFYTLPSTQAPTLVLSGSADPVTPPRHGERVAQALGPMARHVVVPNVGHGTMSLVCMREEIYKFVDRHVEESPAQAASKVDAECLAQTPRATVYVPPRAPQPGARP